MQTGKVTIIAALALSLVSGACNRGVSESRDAAVGEEKTNNVDRVAELQRERTDDIARLNGRVSEIEQEYAAANQKVESGNRTATAGLREELEEDVTNIKKAVGDLGTTTPQNWWDRHEEAMKETADDIQADVTRLAGKVIPAEPATTSHGTGETVSTEPFTSRRDKFVGNLRSRVAAMNTALDRVKAKGPQETEVEDVRARVKKLSDDLDRLSTASADDWWDVTRRRVTEYIDRVAQSVDRLDDNKS
jgi:capsule polysaccharide export protein KpsE/RkpR